MGAVNLGNMLGNVPMYGEACSKALLRALIDLPGGVVTVDRLPSWSQGNYKVAILYRLSNFPSACIPVRADLP